MFANWLPSGSLKQRLPQNPHTPVVALHYAEEQPRSLFNEAGIFGTNASSETHTRLHLVSLVVRGAFKIKPWKIRISADHTRGEGKYSPREIEFSYYYKLLLCLRLHTVVSMYLRRTSFTTRCVYIKTNKFQMSAEREVCESQISL